MAPANPGVQTRYGRQYSIPFDFGRYGYVPTNYQLAVSKRKKKDTVRSRIPQREMSKSKSQGKEDDFFVGLKDQIELLKAISFGLGMVAAAYVVLGSQLSPVSRVAGSMACIFLGVWVSICAVLIYSRQQLKLRGVPRGTQLWRAAQYVVLLSGALMAVEVTADIAEQAIKARGSHQLPSGHIDTLKAAALP